MIMVLNYEFSPLSLFLFSFDVFCVMYKLFFVSLKRAIIQLRFRPETIVLNMASCQFPFLSKWIRLHLASGKWKHSGLIVIELI